MEEMYTSSALPRPEARLVSLGTGRAGRLGTQSAEAAAARGVRVHHRRVGGRPAAALGLGLRLEEALYPVHFGSRGTAQGLD